MGGQKAAPDILPNQADVLETLLAVPHLVKAPVPDYLEKSTNTMRGLDHKLLSNLLRP